MALAKIKSFGISGLDGEKIEVEVDLNLGQQKFEIVGLPDSAVKESKDRVFSAIKNSGFAFPARKITVNLAPASLKKEGSAFDLAIALGILCASGQISKTSVADFVFLGELSLDGSLRPALGLLPILISAKEMGFSKFVVPIQNKLEASYIDGIDVFVVSTLSELAEFLSGAVKLAPVAKKEWETPSNELCAHDLARVKGQALAKRAMEIAVAGGHNILMVGPPGSGKTLLAKCVPSILPDLTFDEAIEITKIQSVAGVLDLNKGIVCSRPFRSPHHTSSVVALTGGGRNAKPGEISLAHNGVLFLDELPEYSRSTLEALRQPLEDGFVTVSRIAQTTKYPANFILVASMNPCPCGNFGSKDLECKCTPTQISKYLGKISGPLLDRIDLKIDVDRVKFCEINEKTLEEPSSAVKKRVDKARKIQIERFSGEGVFCNAKMNNKQIKSFCELDKTSEKMLQDAFEKFNMSARGYTRILKVARTIADLEGSKNILPAHVGEAIAFRNIDKAMRF